DQVGLAYPPARKQTLVQAIEAPRFLGVLARAAQGAVAAEIGAIDALRLLDAPLLQQQRAERMTRRLHPAPGFVIGKVVVELDGFAQMGEGAIMVASAVLD